MIHSVRSLAIRALAAVAMLAGAAGGGSAQVSGNVDSSLLETWRLNGGNTIRFCSYDGVPTAAFDRLVGEAIAERLLLSAEFTTLGANYGIGGEYAVEDLFVSLTNDCDVVLGMGLATSLYPTEFVTTRAYVGFSYVLAVADETTQAITDIPPDERLGAAVGSYGFRGLVRYIATRPEGQRWQALPYGETELMVTRVLDGTIAGMIVYGPTFAEYVAEHPGGEALRVLPLEPDLSINVEVGGLMLARSAYLRTLIDEAIVDMVDGGTVEALLAEAGLGEIPAQPGGN